MIKTAQFQDCHRITVFLERMHREMGQSPVFVRDRVRKMLQIAAMSEHVQAWYVEIDWEVEGVLIGVINQIWYSHDRQAMDLVFVVSELGRGHGGFLARRFVKWATEAGVKWIWMSETISPNARRARMYERMGFTHMGGMYLKEVSNEQPD